VKSPLRGAFIASLTRRHRSSEIVSYAAAAAAEPTCILRERN
jgi:hypothetical protein